MERSIGQTDTAARGTTQTPEASGHRALTYTDLKAFGRKQFETVERKGRDINNLLSGLKSWMKFNCISDSTVIGPEFAEKFDLTFEEYLTDLKRNSSVNEVTGRNSTYDTRKSQVARWHQLYLDLLMTDGLPEAFDEALTLLMERRKESPWSLAARTGVRRACIGEWMAGKKHPTLLNSIKKILALEKGLGVPAHTLLGRTRLMRKMAAASSPAVRTKYSLKIAELKTLEYKLPVSDWPAQLLKEWEAIKLFKTAVAPPFGMKRNKAWRDTTAKKFLHDITFFFGYCLLASVNPDLRKAGAGMKEEDLSFALLTDTALVERFMEFKALRSGGYNAFHKTFIDLMMAFTHGEFGFLTQRPDLATHIGLPVDKDAWEARCAAAKKRYADLKKGYAKQARQTRPPEDPIQKILDLDHPMEALFELEALIEQDRPLPGSMCSVDVWARNLLLIKMLGAAPLRISHFEKMTYYSNNTGHLRQKTDGTWYLRFEPHEFKNEEGAAKELYERDLPADLFPYIKDYLDNRRPNLAGGSDPGCPYVFRPSAKSAKNPLLPLKGDYLSDIVYDLTKKYIPFLGIFFGHAARHIIATNYIKNHPEGYEIAAFILHDTVETVRKAYQHVKQKDRNAVWHNYRAKTLAEHMEVPPQAEGAVDGLKGIILKGLAPDLQAEALKLLQQVVGGIK